MVATLVIEFSLAVYAVWRYQMTVLVRLITSMLVALGVFQLAEYFVCTGIGSMAVPWSRVGFVAITALPPIGLHIMHELAGKQSRKLVTFSYASMVSFMAFFLFSPGIFTGHQCTGNYVIFQFTPNVTGLYSLYYFGWLLTGIGLGLKWSNELMRQGKKSVTRLQTVRGLIVGYLVFLVPSAVVMTTNPAWRRGIPSVLCGFAVLLALILGLYILPRAAERKVAGQSLKPSTL
jgi:hypothetical protein